MWQASPWSRGGWVLSVDSYLSMSSELELEWENSLISLEVNAPSAQGPGNFCLDPPPEVKVLYMAWERGIGHRCSSC